MNVKVVFYSMYGHVWQMAEAVAAGAGEVEGANVTLWQVEELISEEGLAAMGATAAKAKFAHIPVIEAKQLADADVLLFGTPTRYGMMAAQMKNLIDRTGGLWAKGAFIGKLAGTFGSTNSQHCGHEATMLSFHTVLLGLGMVVAGVPPSAPGLHGVSEVVGGSPYGAMTLAGPDGSRQPSELELGMARIQGRHLAELGRRMVR